MLPIFSLLYSGRHPTCSAKNYIAHRSDWRSPHIPMWMPERRPKKFARGGLYLLISALARVRAPWGLTNRFVRALYVDSQAVALRLAIMRFLHAGIQTTNLGLCMLLAHGPCTIPRRRSARFMFTMVQTMFQTMSTFVPPDS